VFKLGIRKSQEDVTELFTHMIARLHLELCEPFIFEVEHFVIVDPMKQILHAAKQHWATLMSNDLYSKVQEVFYYQLIWYNKCLSCNGTMHTFEINALFNVSILEEMKEKRCNVLDLIKIMLGMHVAGFHL